MQFKSGVQKPYPINVTKFYKVDILFMTKLYQLDA